MLARISQKLPELSSAERRVAECVLAQSKWFVQAAVANIAQEARVSQPTVFVFVAVWALAGFQNSNSTCQPVLAMTVCLMCMKN